MVKRIGKMTVTPEETFARELEHAANERLAGIDALIGALKRIDWKKWRRDSERLQKTAEKIDAWYSERFAEYGGSLLVSDVPLQLNLDDEDDLEHIILDELHAARKRAQDAARDAASILRVNWEKARREAEDE